VKRSTVTSVGGPRDLISLDAEAGMTLKQALRIALAAGAFIGFGLGGALLSWIVLPIASLDRDRARRQRRCQRLVQATFVLFHDYMRVCGLVAYDPRGAPRNVPDGPFVLVTNHPTLVDVTALIAAYGELCVVAKGSLFRNPLIGPLLRLCGHIDGGQSGFGTPAHVLDQAIERLRQGQRVLMFPEGTRSPHTGLLRFRSGAFSAAFAAQVPVVPAAIAAQPPGLKKGQAWYAIPTTAIVWTVDVLEPLRTSAFPNARELLIAAKIQIERALARSS
jgi:1-acyl-sn-glycerol-3-phosphate acyltransferase